MPSWNWLSSPTQSPRIMWLSCLPYMTVMPLILPTVISSKSIGDFWKSKSVLVSPVSLPVALKINPTHTTTSCMALWDPWSGFVFHIGSGYPRTLHPSFTESFHSFIPGLPNGAEKMKCLTGTSTHSCISAFPKCTRFSLGDTAVTSMDKGTALMEYLPVELTYKLLAFSLSWGMPPSVGPL